MAIEAAHGGRGLVRMRIFFVRYIIAPMNYATIMILSFPPWDKKKYEVKIIVVL